MHDESEPRCVGFELRPGRCQGPLEVDLLLAVCVYELDEARFRLPREPKLNRLDRIAILAGDSFWFEID